MAYQETSLKNMAVLNIKKTPQRFKLPSAQTVLVAFLSLLAAVLIGLGVALLPPSFSLGLGAFVLAPIFIMAVWMAPKVDAIPDQWLVRLLLAAVFIYFIWPRNAFIPVSILPIKHPQKMLYAGLLLLWIYLLLKCAPFRERLAGRLRVLPWLMYAWLALALLHVLSALFSQEPIYSIYRLMIDLGTVYLLLPVALSVLRDEQDVRALIYCLIAAALINCLYALPEFALRRNLFERVTTLSDIDPAMAKQILMAKLRGGQYRAQGSFDHPLLFSEYLLVILPFSLVMVVHSPKLRKRMVAASLIIMLGLLLSRSRVALAGSAVGVFVLLFIMLAQNAKGTQRNPWPLVISLLMLPVLLGGAYFATTQLGQIAMGRTAGEASSTNARAVMLHDGSKLILESPLLGYGPALGGLELNFRNTEGVLTLDNYLLVMALDAGLISLALFVGVILATAYVAVRYSLREQGERFMFMQAIAAGAISFLVVKSVLGTGLNNMLLPLFMAFLVVLVDRPERCGLRVAG